MNSIIFPFGPIPLKPLARIINRVRTDNDVQTQVLHALLPQTPVDGILSIELVGELAGIMALAQTTNARSDYATGSSLTLVAGVRNHRCRTKLICHLRPR